MEAARHVTGIDLNPEAARVTSAGLAEVLGPLPVALHTVNFFALDPSARVTRAAVKPVDAVVGNPPYIRYQEFKGASRTQALKQAGRAGVTLPQLTSSWAPFVAHAVTFIKPGGRLALILPAELIHATYAAPIRRQLRDCFGELSVISFREAVFPGVQEEVVILLASGRSRSANGMLRLVEARAEDLAALDPVLERGEVFRAGDEPTKWLPGHTESPAALSLARLQAHGLLVPLLDVGKASIGFVSGANDFFVLTPDEARAWKLPSWSLKPCVVRAQQMPGALITPVDVAALVAAGERCLLWLPHDRLTDAEKAYIRHGEARRLHERFKCRSRRPWYRVPGVMHPEAMLTYMSDSLPRLCLNEAGLAASNNLLTVRLSSVPESLRRAFVVAFYNSATLLSCERIGRNYGGGVLKLEPREADRVLVPAMRVIAGHRGLLSDLVDRLHRALLTRRPDALAQVIRAVDDLVLRAESGRVCGEIEELRRARANLSSRRRSRRRAMPFGCALPAVSA